MFSRLSFSDIKECRDLTTIENRSDPTKHVWMCVVTLKLLKGGSEFELYETVLVGSPCKLNICDEIYFLNALCMHRVGVPLLDAAGRTIEDCMKLEEFAKMRDRKVYRPTAAALYKVFHKHFEVNTNVPRSTSQKFRPHGTRTYTNTAFRRAQEQGKVNEAIISAVETQLGHSRVSATSTQRYLSSDYTKTLYFGGFTSKNKQIQGLFHTPEQSLSSRLGLPPNVTPCTLGHRFDENRQIVDDMATEALGSALATKGRTLTLKCLKSYRLRKLRSMKVGYATATLGAVAMAYSASDLVKVFNRDIAARFATLAREEMAEYTTNNILKHLKI